MLAEIGQSTTILAFLAALYAVAMGVYGGRTHSERWIHSARNAAIATFPLLLAATGALVIALMNGEYQMSYVWSVTDPQTPDLYRLTALWGSQEGSILFWSFLMSLFSAGALVLNWRSHYRLMPYATAFMMATLAFFLGICLIYENPFDRWWIVESTGEALRSSFIPAGVVAPPAQRLAETSTGLNALLRHFGMAFHPPTLYLGFVGFIIPFSFAMAALASGDLSSNWIKATRRWALVAWLFLGLGLILGGRWAYDVLGWGGYWGWDPVENAAFLPWLTGTAFLHSVIIQEKRGMLKVWNLFLVVGTFSAVIFGTFATRSGLVDSVHSFAQSSIGFPMFAFWSGMTLISVGLVLWRWNRGELKDEHKFANLFSREALFVLNNIIFVALVIAIFWGSFGGPIVSELFLDTDITLGTEYFLMVTPPLFLAMYILMGIAPLSAWGATSFRRLGKAMAVPFAISAALVIVLIVTGTDPMISILGYGIVSLSGFVALYETFRGASARHRALGENWLIATLSLFRRNRRRYGGYVIHFGIAVIGLGVIGSTLFQVETQNTLREGETMPLGDYELRFEAFRPGLVAADGRIIYAADVSIWRDGNPFAQVSPRIDRFPTAEGSQPMTIAGQHSSIENDIYVIMVAWDDDGATFKAYINPLINFVWYGGIILILGTFVAAWPIEGALAYRRERKQRPVRKGARA